MRDFFKKHIGLVVVAAMSVAVIVTAVLLGSLALRQPQDVENNNGYCRVYVTGAVDVDGYVTVGEGTDVAAVVHRAGMHKNGILPPVTTRLVKSGESIIVDFCIDGVSYSAVNVNGGYVDGRIAADGVSMQAINALADYREAHGTIRNRTQMRVALGELYEDNYYRFFIAEADYEQDS